jgi:hypothetical protein
MLGTNNFQQAQLNIPEEENTLKMLRVWETRGLKYCLVNIVRVRTVHSLPKPTHTTLTSLDTELIIRINALLLTLTV